MQYNLLTLYTVSTPGMLLVSDALWYIYTIRSTIKKRLVWWDTEEERREEKRREEKRNQNQNQNSKFQTEYYAKPVLYYTYYLQPDCTYIYINTYLTVVQFTYSSNDIPTNNDNNNNNIKRWLHTDRQAGWQAGRLVCLFGSSLPGKIEMTSKETKQARIYR